MKTSWNFIGQTNKEKEIEWATKAQVLTENIFLTDDIVLTSVYVDDASTAETWYQVRP